MNIFLVLILVVVLLFITNYKTFEGLTVVTNNKDEKKKHKHIYKACRGNCQQRSPMFQNRKHPLKCLNCTNCGICEYRNGYQECMPGDVYGPKNSGFSPNNCKCWYHGFGVKRYKNRRTGQIKKRYSCWPLGQPFGGSGIQRDYRGYGMTRRDAIQAMKQIKHHENQTGNTTAGAGVFPWWRMRYQRDRSWGPYIWQ